MKSAWNVLSRTRNVIKLVNSLVFLSVFVTLWQEKIATKTLKHDPSYDGHKENKSA